MSIKRLILVLLAVLFLGQNLACFVSPVEESTPSTSTVQPPSHPARRPGH